MTSYRRHLTESIPDYFFIYDVEKQEIIYLSDSFQKFRFKDSEGSNLYQMRTLIHKSYFKAFDKIFNSITEGNLCQDEDLKCRKSGENVKWVNIKTYPVDSKDPKIVAGHIVDSTRKIFYLQKLEKEANELEHIIHVLAHDLRGPLGSILNIFEMQREALKNKDFYNSEVYLAMTDKIANDMQLTINSMVEMIELKSEKFHLQALNTNVTELIRNAVQNHKYDIEQKEIELHISIPHQDTYVKLDNIKFRLIVQNLLTNAIKFTDKGGKITVSLQHDNNGIELKIADTGIGIPEDRQDQIFEQFTRMKRKGTKGERSIGLGLSIVKRITEIHKGQINVLSRPGEGTTFIVKLPKIE